MSRPAILIPDDIYREMLIDHGKDVFPVIQSLMKSDQPSYDVDLSGTLDTRVTFSVPAHIYHRFTGTHEEDLSLFLRHTLFELYRDRPEGKFYVPDERRLKFLTEIATEKVVYSETEWTRWQDLRPAYRDREDYEFAVWVNLVGHPDFETEEMEFGQQVRRQVRLRT